MSIVPVDVVPLLCMCLFFKHAKHMCFFHLPDLVWCRKLEAHAVA